jgi:uncharacterized integral membrane protein
MADPEHRVDAPKTDPIPVQTVPRTRTDQPLAHVRRISGLWVGVIVAALVLIVLLVFIIQNGQTVRISFITGALELPLGVALLLAAICGVLLLAIPGYSRIVQLRRSIRRSGNTRPGG